MMQPQVLQSFLQQDPDHQARLSGLQMGSYACDDHDMYSLITTPEDSSTISTDSYFQTMLPSNVNKLSYFDDHTQVVLPIVNTYQQVEVIEEISGTDLDDVLRWWADSEAMNDTFSDFQGVGGSPFEESIDIPMALPPEDMEVEGQTILCHLLKAYGEAMEMGHRELASVIAGCIKEKASPLGGTLERVAFNLFQSGNQVDYIKQESMKNSKSAFKVFYETFPYGRLCHFAANSAILEAIMSYSGKVHIIDFDMGEAVQWPAMLEAIGKLKREVKLTSIRTNERSYSFEETKNQLLDYANGCGLKLEVQNIRIEDLEWEVERSHEHEFLAFNCMVGLPHMGRTRNRSEVMQFLRTAKKLLLIKEGIITFGDGEDLERRNDCCGFGSYFDDYIMHYHALCESMEKSFPENLREARIAMESLFVWPYVSSFSWYQKWENVRGVDSGFTEYNGLTGCRLSKESLVEAKEMVKEGHSSHNIRVEGQNRNEMVLEWRGTPLVRLSVWK